MQSTPSPFGSSFSNSKIQSNAKTSTPRVQHPAAAKALENLKIDKTNKGKENFDDVFLTTEPTSKSTRSTALQGNRGSLNCQPWNRRGSLSSSSSRKPSDSSSGIGCPSANSDSVQSQPVGRFSWSSKHQPNNNEAWMQAIHAADEGDKSEYTFLAPLPPRSNSRGRCPWDRRGYLHNSTSSRNSLASSSRKPSDNSSGVVSSFSGSKSKFSGSARPYGEVFKTGSSVSARKVTSCFSASNGSWWNEMNGLAHLNEHPPKPAKKEGELDLSVYGRPGEDWDMTHGASDWY